MKQLIQNFKTGHLGVEDVPAPALRDGFVQVQNVFSLISPATERLTVDVGKSSLLGKAQKRPDLVKQVLKNIKKEGFRATLDKVKNKLDAPKALGYSCSGIVLDSMDFDQRFGAGDRVACAGQGYASHSEVVSVPQNLVVKIPDNVSFEEASFTTIGAIALQGVRQADVQIGEKVCVIGLGLIGQLSAQILKANGCDVFGVDTSDYAVGMAQELGIQQAVNREDEQLHKLAGAFTKGHGFDKVIITASTSSDDPVVLATELSRKKGAIVVVGNVKMNIPREPHFYQKELELKISTSYGPGRYDPFYEEAGIDYPHAYVRFTENRNMETFLELLSKKAINVVPLITQTFNFDQATEAYDLILKKGQKFSGILLKYQEKPKEQYFAKIEVRTAPTKQINIGFLGAGSFAQNYLLPHLKGADVSLDTVVNNDGAKAKNAAEKFGFNSASTNSADIFNSDKINTIFIATRHDSHGDYVLQALKAKKHVFVEKPLTLSQDQLAEIQSVYKGESIFTVGYNRRFAKMCHTIKGKVLAPVVANIRVNAGFIEEQHWVQNPDIGGGRVLGEMCHFVDLLTYLCRGLPVKVYSSSINAEGQWRADDNLCVTLEFGNGSLGTITYTAMGDAGLAKERVEVFSAGHSWVIDDFKTGQGFENGRTENISVQGKGHKEEVEHFLESVKFGKPNPIPFEELITTSQVTFKILECLKTGQPQRIG